MRHEANATGIVLKAGIVQSVTSREIPGGIKADLVIGLGGVVVQRFTPHNVPKLAIGCMMRNSGAGAFAPAPTKFPDHGAGRKALPKRQVDQTPVSEIRCGVTKSIVGNDEDPSALKGSSRGAAQTGAGVDDRGVAADDPDNMTPLVTALHNGRGACANRHKIVASPSYLCNTTRRHAPGAASHSDCPNSPLHQMGEVAPPDIRRPGKKVVIEYWHNLEHHLPCRKDSAGSAAPIDRNETTPHTSVRVAPESGKHPNNNDNDNDNDNEVGDGHLLAER